MYSSPIITTNYLWKVYNTSQYKESVKKAKLAIKKYIKRNNIDAIAFTGTSGAAFAYPLSLSLDIPLICIRKGRSHYSSSYEGIRNVKNYIIVDDFISSGATMRKIIRIVKKYNSNAELKSIFLYNDAARVRAWGKYPVISI